MFTVLGFTFVYAGGLIGLVIFLIITFIIFLIDYKRNNKSTNS
jgi:type III secretory pathway component EscV